MKELYRELELEAVYAKYEDETHKQIKELIAKVEDIPPAVRVTRGAEVGPSRSAGSSVPCVHATK